VTPVDGRTPQTITFAQPTDKIRLVDGPFFASVSSSSGLAVTVTSQTPATCSVSTSNQVFINAVGVCTLAANQAGNTSFMPALQVVRSFNIVKAPRSIAFGAPPTGLVWGNTITFSYTTTGVSGGGSVSVTSQTPSICTVSQASFLINGLQPGQCSLMLEWPGNDDIETPTPVTMQVTVNKRSTWVGTVSVTPFTPRMNQSGTLAMSGEDGTRTGALTWSSETPNCTVSGSSFLVLAAGICQFRATRAEDALYVEASRLSQQITALKAEQAALSVTLSPAVLTFGETGTLSITGGSGDGAVTFVSTTPTICSINGNQLTALLGTSFCSFYAIKAADSNYNEKQSATFSFQVQRASQTITWQSLPTRQFGDTPFSVEAFASASSGGTVQFSSTTTNICSTSGTNGTQVTMLAAGTCTLSAFSAQTGNHNSAPAVTQSFTVSKANQTITFATLPLVPVGSTRTVTATGGGSGQPVVVTSVTPSLCTVSGTTVTGIAVGNCTLAANQAGGANHNAAPELRVTLTVGPGTQMITFTPLPIFGPGESVGLSATGGSSGNPVSFTAQTPAVCTVSGNRVTGVAAGQCFVRATQAGNSNYLAADPVDQSIELAAGTWTAAGAMQTARREHAVVRLADGSALAIGGSDGASVSGSVERFDPITRTWSPMAGLNTPRRWHSATSLSDGTVLVVGGLDTNDAPLASVERYNPATNIWTTLAPLPDVRVKHEAILLPDGKVLVAGGMPDFGNDPGMTYLFDPATGAWSQNNYMSYQRSNQAYTFLASGRILFTGGDVFGTPYAEADLYQPATSSWQQTEYMNTGAPFFNYEPRRDHALHTLSDGRAVAIGGVDGNSGVATAKGLVYNEQTGQWATLAPLDAGRERFLSAKLQDGRIFVAGGLLQDGSAAASSRILNADGSVWRGSGSMVTARSGTTLVSLGNGRYLAAGGVGADGAALASSEIFDLSIAVPDAPIMGSAVAGNGSATITFTAPVGQGVTIHTAISSPHGLSGTCTAPCSSIVVNGLTNGTSYTFVVRSMNANGVGPSSAASNAVVPSAPLLAQTITWGTDPVVRVGSSATLSASGGLSGNPVVFTSQTPAVCTTGGAQGATLTGVSIGTCIVAANQAGNAQYAAAAQTTRSFTVLAALPPNFTVTPSAGANGSITPATPQQVVQGATTSFTVTADGGYSAVVSGSCGGNLIGNTYTTLAITADCTVIASFTAQPVSLQVVKSGTGQGAVTSNPAGISCGADCSESLASGTAVTLTATPDAGAGFGGWSGVSCIGGNTAATCSFTLTANTTVTATFDSSLVVPNDFNDDAKSDLIWRNGADGSVQGWLMNGVAATQVAGLLPAGGYTVTHVADLDGNGKADTLIRHTDGTTIGWLHDGLNVVGQTTFFAAGSGWSIKHTADLNGDGKADLIVEHTDGRVVGWLMDGLTVTATATYVPAGTGWSVSKVGDLNGDGKADLIWQNSNGTVQAWLMDGLSATQTATFVGSGTGWSVMLAGDIDGDGKADLFWEHTDGRSQTWLMNGLTVTNLAGFVGAGGWRATHLFDLNGDGKKDVLWKHSDGTVQGWLMNGLTISQIASLAGAGAYEVIPPRP
jgi:Galactose oxidase, central domain/FG-GAP-like repeat/Divergent InlB B-repeat domain/Kelch motif